LISFEIGSGASMALKETNRDLILKCIEDHPEGLDDDELSKLAGVEPRQQVYQIATRLAAHGAIRRESVVKQGKRRKIHNFPLSAPLHQATPQDQISTAPNELWRKRLAALVAATGRDESEVLDEALAKYARVLLKEGID
jgi:hypothetical protein